MTLQLRAEVSTADTDNGLVLLDERSGRYWQLNPTGALVLRLLLDGVIPHQAAQTLAERYPVSTEQAATELHDALAEYGDSVTGVTSLADGADQLFAVTGAPPTWSRTHATMVVGCGSFGQKARSVIEDIAPES